MGLATIRRFQVDGAKAAAIDLNADALTMCGADVGVVADVSDEKSIQKAVDSAVKQLEGLDVRFDRLPRISECWIDDGSDSERRPRTYDLVGQTNAGRLMLNNGRT